MARLRGWLGDTTAAVATGRGRSLPPCLLIALALAPGLLRADELPSPREVRYRESDQAVTNPERGFYAPRMSHRLGRLDDLRGRGITLLLVEVDLKAFKERDLSPEKLDEVKAAFAAARRHGLKLVVRAAYGFTGRDYRADPKDLGRILGHIRQFGAVFRGGATSSTPSRRASSAPGASGTGPTGATRLRGAARRGLRPARPGARADPRAGPPADVHPGHLRRRARRHRTDGGDGPRLVATGAGRLARRRAAEPPDRPGDLRPARLGPRARAPMVQQSDSIARKPGGDDEHFAIAERISW